MALLSRGPLLLVLAAAAGCELPSTPLVYQDESYTVHAVLAAGEGEARVLITRFDPGAGASVPGAGSEVTLASATDTVRLRPARAGVRCTARQEPEAAAGCYSAVLPRPLAAGEHWDLTVRLPGGVIATGEATVLSPPIILAPASGSRIEVRNRGEPQFPNRLARVRFELGPDPGRGDWAVRTRTLAAFSADSLLTGVSCGPGVSFFTGPGEQGSFPLPLGDEVTWGISALQCTRGAGTVAWDSIRAALEVTAFDTTYSRYGRQVAFDPATRPAAASAGIDGAYGVFASVASASREVLFVAVP